MKIFFKRLIKTVFITALAFYACITLSKQELALMKYDKEFDEYEVLIQEEDLKNEQLINTKNIISTEKYIEEVAREKLGLVMPNELIIIDGNL